MIQDSNSIQPWSFDRFPSRPRHWTGNDRNQRNHNGRIPEDQREVFPRVGRA